MINAQPRQAPPDRRASRPQRRRPIPRHRHADIFCITPYDEYAALEPTLARYLPRLLADDGLVVLETSAKTVPELPLAERTTRRYGSARITLLYRE